LEIWRTRDHLGRVVVLKPAGLDHVRLRHQEFARRLEEARSVIERPDFVTRDRHRAHRECFYRQELSGKGLIKVVVHYRPIPPQGTWIGEVITAYHTDHRAPKEVRIWP
jgi:hypothetical protein